MPRMARLVVPGYPHHITQRGSRRQRTFFNDSDYRAYLGLIRDRQGAAGVDIWAYCLMPNHVHLVAVPGQAESLAKLLRDVHHRHAKRVNAANGWRGHLWQERFHSTVMDEPHLLAAVRYVELNPVRSGLCQQAAEWPWSSVHAHLRGDGDGIVNVQPMLGRVPDWTSYLSCSDSPEMVDALRSLSTTGRPAGSEEFVDELERQMGRPLRRRKPGPARRR